MRKTLAVKEREGVCQTMQPVYEESVSVMFREYFD